MIKVTRLSGQVFYLNAELIESIEATPDTVLTLLGGKTVMVRDSLRTVLKRIMRYRRYLHQPKPLRGTAHRRPSGQGTGSGT